MDITISSRWVEGFKQGLISISETVFIKGKKNNAVNSLYKYSSIFLKQDLSKLKTP